MSTSSHKSRIKKLSPLLINQLSAGEVVTRPASVIKELLENAIDAGATQISINITQGGMGLMEISDNGSGIHPDDMLMAVTRHATSKVADVQHLHGILTLGFRGEALASISAVSRLTITSSHDDSGVGRCLTVAGQIDDPDVSPVVCQRGTTVSVRDLYFNVPARRGNLKSIATEYAHIEAVIRHVALVYASIELNLFYEGKRRFSLPVVATKTLVQQNASFDDMSGFTSEIKPSIVPRLPVERLKEALSTQLPDTAHELFVDLSGLSESARSAEDIASAHVSSSSAHIQGWLWLNDELSNAFLTSSDKPADLPKLIYINARLVKDTAISQQIRQAIQSVDLTTHDVGYALFFTLPHQWLNLNVHPSKQRVNIHALTNINAHLQHGLQQLLQSIVADKLLANSQYKNTNEGLSTAHNSQQNSLAINSLSIESNESVNYANSTTKSNFNSNKAEFAKQPTKQVASPKAVYQVDRASVHSSKDSQYLRNTDNTVPEEGFDAILNDSLALVTDKNFEPLLWQILSNPANQWQSLQQAFLTYQSDNPPVNAQDAIDYESHNFIPCVSVMWTDLPTEPITSQTQKPPEQASQQNWILLIFINQQTLATQSAVYNRSRLERSLLNQSLIPASKSDKTSTQSGQSSFQSLDKKGKA